MSLRGSRFWAALALAGLAGCRSAPVARPTATVAAPPPAPSVSASADGPQRVLLDQVHSLAVDDAPAARR